MFSGLSVQMPNRVGGTTLDPFIDLSGLELCLAIPDFTSLVSIHGSGYPGDPSSEDY